MKTPNAFALRGFDSERILQRKYFLKRLSREHIAVHTGTTIDDNEEIKETDTCTIDLMDARNVAHLGSAEMVERLANLQKIESAVADYKRLLDVHKNRLDCLSTRYARNFMETAAQMWQEKYRRAQDHKKTYEEALTSLCDLQKKIMELEQSGEKAIDQQRRKEFATRLQEARQKAGMKQKDVACKVNVALTTIAGYEQGRADPQIPMLIRIAQVLNVSADWLLGLR